MVVDDICDLNGRLSVDEPGAFIAGTAVEEAMRAFGNLFTAVLAAGFTVADLVFVDIAFIDLAEAMEANHLCAELFPESRPSPASPCRATPCASCRTGSAP